MQESTELKALILKWYESRTVGEILGFLERLLSHQDGFMAIGTDLSEWGLGSEQIINGYKEMDRTGKIEVKVVNLRAWCEGAVEPQFPYDTLTSCIKKITNGRLSISTIPSLCPPRRSTRRRDSETLMEGISLITIEETINGN
jgi:hypothetical protein